MSKLNERKNGRNHGEVFTAPEVVAYQLDQLGYCANRNLKDIRILEPASGSGAFALEIIKRLYESSLKFSFSFVDSLLSNVRLVESDSLVFQRLNNNIDNLLSGIGQNVIDFSKVCLNADFLQSVFSTGFDCIVGNPPYIRHERLSEEQKDRYRSQFRTFTHRADLYVTFFEKSLGLLRSGGSLCFICSNRWLTNQYGAKLRQEIAQNFRLLKLLNMEQASPFDEEVIAYPCITLISKEMPAIETQVFDTHAKQIDFNTIKYRITRMPSDSDWHVLFVLYDLENITMSGVIEQGFHIGIGVATGADEVFIRPDNLSDGIESSRLLPLLRTADLKHNKLHWHGQYVLYPYDGGKLCDLEQYPGLKRYLEAHKARLLMRHTVKSSPEKWYKTIDNIKPELVCKPKLLLPDFAGTNWLMIDEGRFYPHHNLYYITGASVDLLKIVATLLMSDFIREQLFRIGIRMNHGLPRFQSQILKKLRLPIIKQFSQNDKRILIQAYDKQDLHEINRIIDRYCQQHQILNTIAQAS